VTHSFESLLIDMDLPNGNAFSFEIKTSTNQYECVSTLNDYHDGLPLSLG